ncbi:MAG: nuclear transport factor 2 family protein [Sphingobacteriales bacterium]|nr:MAG: nuclear transport factor 2 family protein [Sphingobacteriales bacterium]
MNLPKVISDLVKAQNEFDSAAYANCFAESAVVHDEGKVHTGKTEIQQWIAESNEKYHSTMNPLDYQQNSASGILITELSGTFPGSPITVKFHFEINDGLIHSLKVTD